MVKRAKLDFDAPLEEKNKFVHGEKFEFPEIQKSKFLKTKKGKKPDRKPMTVYISPETHKNLKIFAATVEKELSEVNEMALNQYNQSNAQN